MASTKFTPASPKFDDKKAASKKTKRAKKGEMAQHKGPAKARAKAAKGKA